MSHFTYLSRADVRQAITMSEAIGLMGDAFSLLSAGSAALPLRQNLSIPQVGGEFLLMPVCAPQLQHFGLKTVSIHAQNAAKGLPLIHAMVMLLDAHTGRPQALMDGEWLTALRTGAASGLATQLLARADATVAVIVGAGVQARSQLEAVALARPLSTAWVLNRTTERGAQFAAEMSAKLGLPVRVAPSAEVLHEADIVCTATSASQPFFEAGLISPGTHINAVGGYRADMQEIPGEVVAKAKVIVDQREAAMREAGDILIPLAQGLVSADAIHGELGEVLADPRLGRTQDTDITLFKSVGNAIQDLAVATRVLENARAQQIGHALPL